METPDLKQIELEDGWVIQSTDSYITMNGIKLNHGWWLLHNHGGEQGAVNPRGLVTSATRGDGKTLTCMNLAKDETPKYRCESCDKYVPEYIIGFLKLIARER
ncbi:hypothetical protein LCGC14_2938980 [marine sediment metagenome]|uniref:Uncharacterized protein n=1 Tax=marine sediment metagenome TaxID=412755 RepID=A0A0F8ZRB8_9ZZZZ